MPTLLCEQQLSSPYAWADMGSSDEEFPTTESLLSTVSYTSTQASADTSDDEIRASEPSTPESNRKDKVISFDHVTAERIAHSLVMPRGAPTVAKETTIKNTFLHIDEPLLVEVVERRSHSCPARLDHGFEATSTCNEGRRNIKDTAALLEEAPAQARRRRRKQQVKSKGESTLDGCDSAGATSVPPESTEQDSTMLAGSPRQQLASSRSIFAQVWLSCQAFWQMVSNLGAVDCVTLELSSTEQALSSSYKVKVTKLRSAKTRSQTIQTMRNRLPTWQSVVLAAICSVSLWAICYGRSSNSVPTTTPAGHKCWTGRVPKFIHTLRPDEQDFPTGKMLPTVILHAPCLMDSFKKVAFHYTRSAEAWYFVKTDTVEKIEVRFTHEEPVVMTKLLHKASAIEEWLHHNVLPQVGKLNELTSTFYGQLQERERGLIIAMFDPSLSMHEVDETYRPMLAEVARAVNGFHDVTYIDTREHRTWIESQWGVTSFPAIVVQKTYPGPSEVYTGELRADAVLRFVQDSDNSCFNYKPNDMGRWFGHRDTLTCDASPVLGHLEADV